MALFPDMERARRESLTDSMANALDEAVFNGNNSSGQLNGRRACRSSSPTSCGP